MPAALPLLLGLLGIPASEPGCQAPVGYLCQPAFCIDDVARGPTTPYFPQPGDLLFRTDHTVFWTVTHDWAGAGHPHHSGFVIARPDGRLASLEAGPYDTLHLRINDLPPHFDKYTELGEPIWVRRRKTPLSCEQSARLTAFALAQEGKHFALIRQGAQLTPLRCRGDWRTEYLGKPNLNRVSYFCSGLVTTALVAACLFDPADARPAATYPSDLFFGCSANPFVNEHLNVNACWDPPARWLGCPVPGPDAVDPRP
jgi:hypothetical protein